ncbi:MAG: hypothetical protein LBF78_13990 [Treponema sp.]|jgi:hypothetical protein|nr:hypothetical protein [Treponema sp.]
MRVNLNRNKNKGIYPHHRKLKFPDNSIIFLPLFFFLTVSLGFAQDFGLVLNQKAELKDGEKSYGAIEYTGTVLPWFSMPLGDKADLYLSGGFSAEYIDDEWKPLPEIYRFEYMYNFRPGLRLEIGRLSSWENSYVMAGLFDGASFRLNIGGGRLSGGVFYTGLLYKKSAYIVMSPEDRTDYDSKDVYFASRRLAAGVKWECTGIFDTRNTLVVSGAAQFDLNGNDTLFHSQYLQANLSIPLGGRVNVGFGGVIELVEKTGENFYTAFAGSTEIQWMLPTALQDRFSFTGWFSSGNWNGRVGVFIPLTMQARGKVLRPECSGIALLEAAYTVRIHPKFATDVSGAYYFRTDTVTFYHSDINPISNSPLLGGEIYGGLTWTPFSDVLISTGGGVFFPRTGKVFTDNADIIYRVSLTASISF